MYPAFSYLDITYELPPPVISYAYDPLGRLVDADYSTGESFEYQYDAVGNRKALTSTTPLSGTLVTTYTYDAVNRLTDRAVSDGRVYSYTWSARGQMLAEWTQGYPVRTFTYDGAGQMVEATVFTLTTRFKYNGLGARVAVEVVGQGATTYTLDYAAGNRILAETTDAGSTLYLYGHDCLGERRDGDWLYYLSDAEGLVRQGVDEQGWVVSNWLFDPDGTVLEGPEGLVSHLVCGGVYDWSTGLIYKNGRYFDPMLGIWLALVPLVVVQSWQGRKKKRRGFLWVWLLLLGVCVGGALTACHPSKEQLQEFCIDLPVPGLPAECPDMPTTGAEPPYEPDKWNDCHTIQWSNNCYSYALNNMRKGGGGFNPGELSWQSFLETATTQEEAYELTTCENIKSAAMADGLLLLADCDEPCNPGQYKVAFAIDPYEGKGDKADYHWYRQDEGGCWSCKPSTSYATNLDPAGNIIADPRRANVDYRAIAEDVDMIGFNYTEFCYCFCVQ